MTWQPIETCPSGVDVLVFDEFKNIKIAMDCQETPGGKRKFIDQQSHYVGRGTYWMPLPEPPEL